MYGMKALKVTNDPPIHHETTVKYQIIGMYRTKASIL